jgi:hypothetical protein
VYRTCADNAGPGYVAKMTTKAGHVFFDDSAASQAPVGLGKFVFRIARADQYQALSHPGNTYHMDGKQCAGINATSTGAWNAGVNNGASGLVGGPGYQASGDFGWLWANVVFQDPYGNVLRVLYKWRIYGNYLKVWADVVELCNGGPGGSCGSPAAWLKGPKFVAGVNGWPDAAGFTQMTTYDDAGGVVCTPQDYNDPGVNSNRPCAAATRSRLQFNYTDPQNPPLTGPPNCFSYQRCFNAIFRSYVPDGTLGSITPDRFADYWTGAGGLDAWARTADGYPAQGNANTCTQTAPSQARQWESGGWKYDANGDGYVTYLDRYSSANGNFFGWRDCVNVEDDPALYRALRVEQWGTYASFSFNYDGVNYFPQTMKG